MEWNRILSLFAASFGLVGALFLAKGVLVLNPRDMLHLTSPYSRFDYAPEQINSMAIQKSDVLTGVIYILIAFFIQVISFIFITHQTCSFIKSKWMLFWIVFSIISITTIIFTIMNSRIRVYYKIEIGKIALKDHCIHTFSRKPIDPVNVKGIECMAQELLGFKRRSSESMKDFINRVASCIGWTVPDNIDFSKFNEK